MKNDFERFWANALLIGFGIVSVIYVALINHKF